MATSSSYFDETQGSLITEINVIPLVDIVLVLLIVFMITMPTIVVLDAIQERELSVDLPQASEARPLVAKPQEIVVNIDAEGRFRIRQSIQSPHDVLQWFEQAQANNPDRVSVTIRADRRCRWEHVAVVINLCIKARIRDYRVGTVE
jgi:biopolymer transport protein ExbD